MHNYDFVNVVLQAWLLDSYVVMCGGVLEEEKTCNGNGDSAPLNGNTEEGEEDIPPRPFPALKLLYKVFNSETAARYVEVER